MTRAQAREKIRKVVASLEPIYLHVDSHRQGMLQAVYTILWEIHDDLRESSGISFREVDE